MPGRQPPNADATVTTPTEDHAPDQSTPRVAVLGSVSVHHGADRLQGLELGGRRTRVALVALAVARRPVSAERLADIVWAGDPPTTWPAALRNVVRDLRTALHQIGLGDQRLITTQPSGYALHPSAQTDLDQYDRQVAQAEDALTQSLFDQAIRLAEEPAQHRGEDLLDHEDGSWLEPYRTDVDRIRARAWEVIAVAAGHRGDHHRAIAAARHLVEDNPIDERAFRVLIAAQDKAGDRSGVVQTYERCRAVLAEQLGVDPTAETVELYLAALRSDTLTPGTRLPTAKGSYVGRRSELEALTTAVAETGAITVIGRGGVGKSRLALQVAQLVRREHETRWAGLGAVTDDELVAAHLALELGATVGDADTHTTLIDFLAPLGRTLLVLDGCEQVTDGVATLVSALVGGCPQLTVLATSRHPLGVEQERTIVVAALPHPGAASVELLTARVREAGGTLPDDRASRLLVAEVCERCAGLPLALELVAAQLTDMSLADLLDELPAPGRHDQLEAVLQHSYDLLAPVEATVFRRCAVLAGPVSLPLIRAVASDERLAPVRVTRILRELTAGGLLNADRSGPRWRYQQDDDVRRFALGLLDQAGEEAAALGNLADALRSLLPEDARQSPMSFTAAITEVAGCVRSLLGACVDGRLRREVGLEIGFRLHRYWAATNVSEGRFWLSRLLDGAEPGRWAGLAGFAHGYLIYWAGDARATLPVLTIAVDQLRGIEDGFAARALIYLAGISDDLDRGDDALRFIQEAVSIAERLGDRNLYVGAAAGVGSVLAERGDQRAADYAIAAIESCRTYGSPEQLATTLPTAAMICWQVGDLARASSLAQEARPLLGAGARIARVVMFSVSAGLALADGHAAEAVEFGRTADAEAAALGVDRELPLIRCLLSQALLAVGDLPGAVDRAAAALQAARALSYDFPLALCLETAAVVLHAAGVDRLDAVAVLLQAAEVIRDRGDRPVPPTLKARIDRARVAIGPAARAAMEMDAADLATRLLLSTSAASGDPVPASDER